MTERLPGRLLKIATFRINLNRTYERNTLVLNHDGSPMHVFQAPMIQALAKGLGVTFNIVIPEDNTFGYLNRDGKSTGLIGMLLRGETDLSVSGFTITKKALDLFPFTYPLHITESTFMTNKLEHYPKSFAVIDVFFWKVWLSIGMCLILFSYFLYILLKRRKKYSTILLESIGCLLEQSFSFEARQKNTVLLLLHWFIGITIITTSYKAVILSIMTVPRMDGIRDIPSLSKAVKQNLVQCFSLVRLGTSLKWSKIESSKIIGECVLKTNSEGFHGLDAFFEYPHKKTFLAERIEIRKYHRYYHVSEDSLHISFIGIPYSKAFCCPRKLETVVHRIVAAGLYEKTLSDEDSTAQLSLPIKLGIVDDGPGIKPLKLQDFTGAFFVLFVGYLLSLLVFVGEIVSKKLH